MKRKLIYFIYIIVFASVTTGCNRATTSHSQLSRMLIIDRNGVSETISDAKRLKKYQFLSFEGHQPYQKVIRYFKSRGELETFAVGSTYYPNGQIHQYLEGRNSRAHGTYKQWYPHGQLKAEAFVIAGVLDFQDEAMETWIFDSSSTVYSEEGVIIAQVNYNKGLLQGEQKTYDNCGSLLSSECYDQGVIVGIKKQFYPTGQLKSKEEYCQGKRHGETRRFWPSEVIQSKENWHENKIIEADYYDSEGSIIASVRNGYGKIAHFENNQLTSLHQVQNGNRDGLVEILDSNFMIREKLYVSQGLKNGLHTIYYEGTQQPKIEIPWATNMITGVVKTWYPNGILESQKEYQSGKRDGLHSIWYFDGRLMMIEEYSKDSLIRGEYFNYKTGQKISQVDKGSGEATLCSPQGQIIQRIEYKNGQPQVNE